MTTAEREMLLKLWDDCPDTKPKELDCFAGKWEVSVEPGDKGSLQTIHDDYAAAIARDAMVGWMISQSMRIGMKCVLGAKLFDGTSVQYSAWNHGPNGRNQGQGDGDTLLLALVATCRKIAGKDSA